jgi:quaternary ammonium compound-resistance protein SugE
MTLSFIYLAIAALLQVGWLYNIKQIKKGIWKEIKTSPLSRKFELILPIILYVTLGVLNVIFLTWSMNQIPPSIAYSVWTGIVIAAAAIIDQIILKKPMRLSKIIFILMILAGIIGLKLSTQ